jgi:Mn2+/Fe2+ NRAMP family transporter
VSRTRLVALVLVAVVAGMVHVAGEADDAYPLLRLAFHVEELLVAVARLVFGVYAVLACLRSYEADDTLRATFWLVMVVAVGR